MTKKELSKRDEIREEIIKFFKESGKEWNSVKFNNEDIKNHLGFNLCVDDTVSTILSVRWRIRAKKIYKIMMDTWSIGLGKNKKERFKKISEAIAKGLKKK